MSKTFEFAERFGYNPPEYFKSNNDENDIYKGYVDFVLLLKSLGAEIYSSDPLDEQNTIQLGEVAISAKGSIFKYKRFINENKKNEYYWPVKDGYYQGHMYLNKREGYLNLNKLFLKIKKNRLGDEYSLFITFKSDNFSKPSLKELENKAAIQIKALRLDGLVFILDSLKHAIKEDVLSKIYKQVARIISLKLIGKKGFASIIHDSKIMSILDMASPELLKYLKKEQLKELLLGVSLLNANFGTTESLTLKIVKTLLLTSASSNEFLEMFLLNKDQKVPILKNLTKGLDGESFKEFVKIIHLVWLYSDYAEIDPKKVKKIKITDKNPPVVNYTSDKILGFHTDNAEFEWEKASEPNLLDSIKIDLKVKRFKNKTIKIRKGGKTIEGPEVSVPVIEYHKYNYHPFSPVILVNSENPKFILSDDGQKGNKATLMPAFVLYANNESAIWENIFTGIEYAVDIFTTVIGMRTILLAGRLFKVLESGHVLIGKSRLGTEAIAGARYLVGYIEVAAGAGNGLLKITGFKDTQLGKDISNYLFLLEMGVLGGELSVALFGRITKLAGKIKQSDEYIKTINKLKNKTKNADELKEIDEAVKHFDEVSNLNFKIEDFFKRFKNTGKAIDSIIISEIVKKLRNVTPQSTKVARALNKRKIGKRIMHNNDFERQLEAFGGKGNLSGVTAFEYKEVMYFREGTSIDKYFNELVHEGTHALDSASKIAENIPRLTKETGDIIHEGERMEKYIKGLNKKHLLEFRARIFEREFQIASKQTPDFNTIKELIKEIKEFY